MTTATKKIDKITKMGSCESEIRANSANKPICQYILATERCFHFFPPPFDHLLVSCVQFNVFLSNP